MGRHSIRGDLPGQFRSRAVLLALLLVAGVAAGYLVMSVALHGPSGRLHGEAGGPPGGQVVTTPPSAQATPPGPTAPTGSPLPTQPPSSQASPTTAPGTRPPAAQPPGGNPPDTRAPGRPAGRQDVWVRTCGVRVHIHDGDVHVSVTVDPHGGSYHCHWTYSS